MLKTHEASNAARGGGNDENSVALTSADAWQEPVAIVGIGLRFSGGASDPQSFWNNLCDGKDCITEIPDERWNSIAHYASGARRRGKSKTKWGGLVDDITGFDSEFFNISPRESETLDPQQRMLLEVCWNAFEDAGLPPAQIQGSRTGVFIGGFTLDYMIMQLGGAEYHAVEPHTATGSMMTMLSNRLSYVLGLNGPSLSVDTACSSSLVAAHLACQSLMTGESEIAIAGGVNALLGPGIFVAESQAGMLSPTGRSRAFDSRADGYVRGEGAGIVVLKKLSRALADKDRIYALIKSTAVNQDGHSEGLTIPSGAAQANLMKEAYSKAGISPSEIAFVEAHGTGTPVGDPIESNAIGSVVGAGRDKNNRCYISSVKTNIGHTEAAAGVAGLIKAALCLHHRALPPHLHLKEVNPKIDLDTLGLDIPCELTPLDKHAPSIYAGVNSFGFGGTNAHAVLQSAPWVEPAKSSVSTRAASIVTLSAHDRNALQALANRFADHVETLESPDGVAEFACTVATRRTHHPVRTAVVGSNTAQIVERLRAVANVDDSSEIIASKPKRASTPGESTHPLVWVFTGMGPQWWGMGQQLYHAEPIFRTAILDVCERFKRVSHWSLLDELLRPEAESRVAETQISQPANFAIQIALAALWRSWGIEPTAVVGHSAGEPAGAYVAGALSLDDAVDVIYHRSRLQQQTTGYGRLIAVGVPELKARLLISQFEPDRLSIAAVNSPGSVTIAGDDGAVQELHATLQGTDIFSKVLHVNVPYHSHIMEPLRDEILDSLKHVRPHSACVSLYSTVDGKRIDGSELNNEYWYRNVREPVAFFTAVETMIADGYREFLEIGPHPVLSGSINEAFAHTGGSGSTWHSLRRGDAEQMTILSSLAQMYSYGFEVRWNAVYRDAAPANFLSFPCYPWQHRTYWSEASELHAARLERSSHPILARRLDEPLPTWDIDLNAATLTYVADHTIQGSTVFPGAGYIEAALAAMHSLYGDTALMELADVEFRKALYVENEQPLVVRLVVEPKQSRFTVYSHRYGLTRELWEINATGRICVRHAGKIVPLAIEPVMARCTRENTREECYRNFRSMGLEYGPQFQGIQRLHCGDGEVLAELNLAKEVTGQLNDYQIHPVLLDNCLQTMAAVLPPSDNAQTQMYMPVSIGRVRRVGDPQQAKYVHAQLLSRDASGLTCEIHLLDENGAAVMLIERCRARAFGGASKVVTTKAQDIYRIEWQACPIEPSPETALASGTWIIFGDDDELEHAVVSDLARRDQICVRAGRGTGFSHDRRRYAVGLSTPADFDQLFDQVANETAPPLRGVVYLWPASCVGMIDAGAEVIDAAIDRTCIGLLHVLQALAKRQWSVVPKLWAVTRNAQPVGSDITALNVLQSPLWGLSKVAGQVEHSELWGGIVDLEARPSSSDGAFIAGEILLADHEDQVAYRAGIRHVPRLTMRNDLRLREQPMLRSDISYLITGGLGALGLVTARWMVENGARHIILVGREGLPPRSQWQSLLASDRAYGRVAAVRAIEALGGHITIAAVDITDAEALRNFVTHYENECRPVIKGVIHAAGVARPQLLVDMSAKEFHEILRPKVHGALNLCAVLSGRDLDLFVNFSSIAAVVVSTGQGNYSAANAFLDALAHRNHASGRGGLSINWGPWGEVGMAADLNLVEFFEQRGFYAMTTAQGLDALGSLLGGSTAQATVVAADWARAVDVGYPMGVAPAHLTDVVAQARAQVEHDSTQASGNDVDFLADYMATDDAAQRAESLERHLKTIACRVLRIADSNLDRSDLLNMRGMDSMMAIEMKNRIERSVRTTIAIVDLLRGASIASLANAISPGLEQRRCNQDATVAGLVEAASHMSEAELSALLATDAQEHTS